jgi:hypothetical protein
MCFLKNAIALVCCILLFEFSFSLVQGAESDQDPNLLLSKAREVFSANLKLTVKANGFVQMYSQRLRPGGGRDTREEFPLGTNGFGEINDTYHRVKVLNGGGGYEIYPAGRVAIHDPAGIKNRSRFAGVILSNDPFFFSKTILFTNKSVPEVVVEVGYTGSVWNRLNTDSKTPYRSIYWLDKKTMLPIKAITQNIKGEVLTVVEFLSIESNPEFSHFDFNPEKDVVVFSGVTVEREVEIITKNVPFTVGKIAGLARFIQNPSTPSLVNADRSKRVASNLVNIKPDDFSKTIFKNGIGRIIVFLFMFISSFFVLLPLYRMLFLRRKSTNTK